MGASLLGPVLVAPASLAAEAPPRDPTARAEWLSNQAETAFAEKRFADAIRLYLDAWEAAPAASILYNVAFIYDKRLSDPELAIDYYERAARAPDADQALIDKARQRVETLRAELGKKPPKDPPKDPPKKDPPKDPPKKDPPQDDPLEVDPRPGLGPILVTIGGGALLTGGLVVGIFANKTHGDFAGAETPAEKRELQSRGKSQSLIADVLMGAGVLTLGAGLVWMLLEPMPEAEGRVQPVRVEPLFLPGGAGLSVGGRL
ncbi:MAG: hypothetical protein JNJ59_14365 [Deltaproteobacteria bacterium]|jgi:tetratricopeptide (TPR) repeat protein|nr:hypothetical protein [Deltaproteobacteria bacterium]